MRSGFSGGTEKGTSNRRGRKGRLLAFVVALVGIEDVVITESLRQSGEEH